MCLICLFSQKNTVKTLFGGVITNNVVSLVSLKRSMVFYLHVFCSSVRHILANLICQEYIEGTSLN